MLFSCIFSLVRSSFRVGIEKLLEPKNETLIFLFNSIQFNKNINPNDITIDLNDERISLLRITQNDHDEFPSPRRSYLIRKKNTPNSIRLSELLAEKTSIKPARDTLKQKKSPLSRDSKFPHDTEVIEEQYTEKTNPMKEEYNDYNYNQNSKSSYNQYNIILSHDFHIILSSFYPYQPLF